MYFRLLTSIETLSLFQYKHLRGKVSVCHIQAAHLNNIGKVSTTQVLAFRYDPLDRFLILQYHVLTHVVPFKWL